MFNQTDIKQLFLKNTLVLKKWRELLVKAKIDQLVVDDYQQLDGTVGLYAGDELVGTVSYQGEIIKYVAVCEKYKNDGRTFNILISAIIQEMSTQQIFHYQVITKSIYQKSFEFLGFNTIAQTNKMVFLENGDTSINDFLASIPPISGKKIAAIVMNANPFTKGHQHLIERAAKENDGVYIFVLEKEQPLFTSEERFKMVKDGVKTFPNVKVISGSDYIISPGTFPAYFLRKDDDIAKEQMKLDAMIFKKRIAPKLNITARYLGKEPLSNMTNTYNQVLKEILQPEIQVVILSRILTAKQQVISATQVRTAFLNHQLSSIKAFVPQTTYAFLENKEEKELL